MNSTVDVAIVGAGPYGLSIAATLRAQGVQHRIFGVPMKSWAEHMPRGMHLKSEAFASNLYDISGQYTLENFCKAQGLPYKAIGWPVPLAKFVEYGRDFQRNLVPHLEEAEVIGLDQAAAGFTLTLSTGERLTAKKVILATGIRFYDYLPKQLEGISAEYVSHTFDHAALDKFAGRSLAVIGGGASALGFAALSADAGANVQVFVREKKVDIHEPPHAERPLIERVRAPWTGLGPGWRNWACVHLPVVFRMMPERLRMKIIRKHLGPSGNWTIKKTIEEKVPVHGGMNLKQAAVKDGKLQLTFATETGTHEVAVDHLVAGTGFKPELDRLGFIEPGLRAAIARQTDGSPALNTFLEASIPGLYFAGVSAASSFGPMLRFVYGVEFASKRIGGHVKTALARRRKSARPVALKPVLSTRPE